LGKKSKFVCKICGYTSFKWIGKCPECGEWDCLIEEKEINKSFFLPSSSHPKKLSEIPNYTEARYPSKINEFDRMLGGGVVPGSVILVGGEPGIGKSTLLMEVAAGLSAMEFPILYVSGEESLQQTRMRTNRLGIESSSLFILAENNLDAIQKQIKDFKVKSVIIDSIQTVYLDDVSSSPGSISQVKECTSSLVRIAKTEGIATFLVGHVTKDGSIAGPRIMEHMVDTVLYFESSKDYQYRILRVIKNRFGPTSEIGIFKMVQKGLVEVVDSSSLFITDSFLKNATPGTTVTATVEGSRVFLIEIQALTSRANSAVPRRITQGVDYNKICLLLAVLEKRGFNFYQKEVYVNVPGGVKVEEPACDLAIALSVTSSIRNRAIKPKTVIMGEVGLTGEIRPVGLMQQRLREAKKLGFKRCIGPSLEQKETTIVKGVEFIGVRTLEGAIQEGLKEN